MTPTTTPLDSSPASAGILVSDFDGTMTRHDFYQLVRARWWQGPDPDPWLDYLAGRLTHFEALNIFFARVRTDEASLKRFVDGMQLDPTLPASLERLHQAGWQVVIASAGCDWYIRHLLSAIRTPITLHANPGRFDPQQGLQMIPPTDSPFYSRQTGIDKVAVVRDALTRSSRVAFAGDGPPDVEAACQVSPQRRFARAYLAEALSAKGEDFQVLGDWQNMTDVLLESKTP